MQVEFWASPEQIDSLAMQEIGFADVTDTYDLESFGKQRAFNVQSYPTVRMVVYAGRRDVLHAHRYQKFQIFEASL